MVLKQKKSMDSAESFAPAAMIADFSMAPAENPLLNHLVSVKTSQILL